MFFEYQLYDNFKVVKLLNSAPKDSGQKFFGHIVIFTMLNIHTKFQENSSGRL